MPKYSIVIPCYNAERFIARAIRSCLNQSDPDLEVIVVDDGSTDGSATEVDVLAREDRRVVVHRQANAGLGAARNVGLRLARGEYLNFLDADDELEPTKLAKQGEVLDANPHMGLVLCDGLCINEHDEVTSEGLLRLRRFQGPAELFAVLFSGGQFPPLVPLIRKRIALDVGGMIEDRESAGWADTHFWLRVALRCPAYHLIEEPLCRYRLHATNMSGNRAQMEKAAQIVFSTLMSSHPAQCAEALRNCHRRLADLEHAVVHLRRKLDEQVAARMASEARLHFRLASELDSALQRIIATAAHQRRGYRLMVWGAGSGGRRVADLIAARKGRIAGFIDSDPQKAGSELLGVRVLPPDSIERDVFIVVASSHADAISAQLSQRGLLREVDFMTVDFAAVAALEREAQTATA